MRDKINIFYYPEMAASNFTLKKAILFFDEIHFMDRPSFSFGNFGSVGAESRLVNLKRRSGKRVFLCSYTVRQVD
jgi:hypothetical protein